MTHPSSRRAATLAVASAAGISALLTACGGEAAVALPASLQGVTLDTLFQTGVAQGESWQAHRDPRRAMWLARASSAMRRFTGIA